MDSVTLIVNGDSINVVGDGEVDSLKEAIKAVAPGLWEKLKYDIVKEFFRE